MAIEQAQFLLRDKIYMENFFSHEPEIQKNIVYHKKTRPCHGNYVDISENIDTRIKELLGRLGIQKLYSHQVKAIRNVLQRKNTVITTGVASGKSFCFQLPILESLLEKIENRSLLLFPTKALTQDQNKSLSLMLESLMIKARTGIYDGDTPPDLKLITRTKAQVIFSNPDMLHLGILPHHTKWKDFFSNLKYVIVDEVHIYRGVFGSHTANLLRRLKRICCFYKSNPTFIMTSATLSNVEHFVEKLIEMDFEIISENTAPEGEKHNILYNPPIVNHELGIRRSALQETIMIALYLYRKGLQSIVFATSRKQVETIVKYLKNSIENPETVCAYRSGYLPETRRRVENGLKNHEILTVVSTNALELGIDIGSVDAVIMYGYPGSITSFRQQIGRAGRKFKPSLGIMVAAPQLIDQYIVQNPEYLFWSNPEEAHINPDNPYILLNHLKCALFEKPFYDNEDFGLLPKDNLHKCLAYLQSIETAHSSNNAYYYSSVNYPADGISLRSTGASNFAILLNKKLIGLVDEPSAFWMLHPQAVYLHGGETFIVKDLDLDQKTATIEELDPGYYTVPQTKIDHQLLKRKKIVDFKNYTMQIGDLKVIERVTGFIKHKWLTGEIIGSGEVELPQTDYVTVGFWLTVSESTIKILESREAWDNKKIDYGSDWYHIKQKIKKRDSFTCQNCLKKEGQTRLHIHHKTPFRLFGDAKKANSESNLITLCPTCHNLAEKNLKIISSLGGLAYIIRNLAPLYVMSDKKDLSVTCHNQIKFSGNKPGLVIHDNIPGGIGLSEKLFVLLPDLIEKSISVLVSCPCKNGCPSCIGPTTNNSSTNKIQIKEFLLTLTHDRS